MQQNKLIIDYSHCEGLDSLPSSSRELVEQARCAAQHSYSPYSKFAVGAAARMSSGAVVSGTNIESEVFPAGICAERVMLANVASNYPNEAVVEVAITSISSSEECYPCGLCRQSLVDQQRRQQSAIRVVMAGAASATVVESAELLLPFTFKL